MSKLMEHGEPGPETDPGEQSATRFRGGDERAFDDLVRSFQARVHDFALRMLGNPEEARDAAQEVFVKVYRSIGSFRGESKFTTWLFSLTANTCRNRLRRSRRIALFETRSLDDDSSGHGACLEACAGESSNPLKSVENAEIGTMVEKCLAALPPDFRMAVMMKDMQDMEYADIARAMGCSMGTVKSRISRGRNLLKERLRPYMADAGPGPGGVN